VVRHDEDRKEFVFFGVHELGWNRNSVETGNFDSLSGVTFILAGSQSFDEASINCK
jgi:hypothetical protein